MPFGSDYYDDPMIGGFDPRQQTFVDDFTGGMLDGSEFGPIQDGAMDQWGPDRAAAAYAGGGMPEDPFQPFPSMNPYEMTAEQLQRQTAAKARYDQAQQVPDYLQGYDVDAAERERLLQQVGNRQRFANAGDAVAQGMERKSLTSAWLGGLGELSRGREQGDLAMVSQRMDDRTQKSELATRWTADRKAAADELAYASGGYGSSSRRRGPVGPSTGTSPTNQKALDLERIKNTANHYAPIILEKEGGNAAMNAAMASGSYEAIDQMLGRYSEEYRNAQEGGGWEPSTADETNVEINRYTQQKRRLLTEEGKFKMVQDARASVVSNWSRLSELVKDPRIKSEIDSLVDVVRATVYSDPRMGVDPQQLESTGGDGNDLLALNKLENLFKVGGFEDSANENAGRIAKNSLNELRQAVKMSTGTVNIPNTGNMYGGSKHKSIPEMAKNVQSDEDVNDIFDMIRSSIIATEERYPSNKEIQATFTAMRNGQPKTGTDAAGNTNSIASSKAAGISVAGPGASSVEPEAPIEGKRVWGPGMKRVGGTKMSETPGWGKPRDGLTPPPPRRSGAADTVLNERTGRSVTEKMRRPDGTRDTGGLQAGASFGGVQIPPTRPGMTLHDPIGGAMQGAAQVMPFSAAGRRGRAEFEQRLLEMERRRKGFGPQLPEFNPYVDPSGYTRPQDYWEGPDGGR